jgi:hypothetical protein
MALSPSPTQQHPWTATGVPATSDQLFLGRIRNAANPALVTPADHTCRIFLIHAGKTGTHRPGAASTVGFFSYSEEDLTIQAHSHRESRICGAPPCGVCPFQRCGAAPLLRRTIPPHFCGPRATLRAPMQSCGASPCGLLSQLCRSQTVLCPVQPVQRGDQHASFMSRQARPGRPRCWSHSVLRPDVQEIALRGDYQRNCGVGLIILYSNALSSWHVGP